MIAGRTVAFLVAALVAWPRLPAALPADASADVFAAERAMAHVREWAREPRPSGSAAHARVLVGIEGELARSGWVVQREEAPGGLVNLVAHAPGASGEGGVWLAAHSDSVRRAPGAADDGLGLGVVVEASRVLARTGGLHVLVTDGEERGLLGARAHVSAAGGSAGRAARVVINVEARGTEGPAYMFQTAGPTARMMDAWRRSGCDAQATSLARAVYDQLPNDTDFTVFRQAGWWGYDFALIGGAWRYHTPEDTPENLDPRSVQQVGDCVVGLARAWLEPDAGREAAGSVYFQALGGTVAAPSWLVRVLGVATILALPPRRGALRGLIGWLGALVLAFGAGLAVQTALATRPWFVDRPAEMAGPEPVYALALAIGLAVGAVVSRQRSIRYGWHLAGVALAAITAVFWPVVGYVLLPGAWASVLVLRERSALAPAALAPAALVPAALAGLVVGPVLCAIYPALTTRMLPVLCVVPVILLGWIADAPRGRT